MGQPDPKCRKELWTEKKIINGIISDIRNAFHGLDLKTVILKTLPYLLFAYFGNKLAYAYHCSEKKEALNRVMDEDLLQDVDAYNMANYFDDNIPVYQVFNAYYGVGGYAVTRFSVFKGALMANYPNQDLHDIALYNADITWYIICSSADKFIKSPFYSL